MPEIIESLGDPTCPAFAQPNILARMASLFTAPAGLDRMGAVKTSTRQRAFEICEWSAKQGRPLHVLWGKVSNPSNTEHYGGYGVDFMTFSNAALTKHDRAIGDGIVEYMLANRVRLKLKGLIWRQRRIGYSSGWVKWVPMADRGSATANHYDHVHGLFSEGAYVPPAATTPPVVQPAPLGTVWVDLLVPGVKNSASWRLIQRALGVPETGEPDAATLAAARGYQESLGDDVDGWLGPKQVARLFADKAMAVEIRTDPSGQAPKPTTPAPPVVVKPTPKPEPDVDYIETIFGWNILRRTDDVDGRDRYNVRKPKIGKTLRDAKASVYLLIETDDQSRKDAAAALGNGYSYWGFKYYGIFWQQSVWERRGNATNEFLFRDKNNRWLLSLPLFHKKSGKQITFDVTHLENDGDPNSDGHSARKVEVTHLVERASKGNRVGFFDANSTTPAIIAKPSAHQEEKPRRILHRAGARFVSSLGTKVKNLAYGSHHGGKSGVKGPLIDDGWVMGDVQLVDAEIVRTDGTDASDHNAIKFRIKL